MAQTKTAEPLPNSLPGAVVAQYRERDGKRYGPYYCRCWREGGKLRKRYVKRTEVAAVRAACRRHRDERAERRRTHAAFVERLRLFKATCREVERWLERARLLP